MSVQAISATTATADSTTQSTASTTIKTTTTYNLDGSDTVIVTDANGTLISITTIPAAHPPAATADIPAGAGPDHAIDVTA
jgi:hypothetical protein